jgi:YHS domain-containing protein
VRVTVPGGHLNAGMRAELIGRVTEVLAGVDEKPDRLYREPKAWVQIIELPDSQLGGFGQVMPTHEIVKMVVDPSWKPVGNSASSGKAGGQETVIDPICGMTVVLDDTAITLEHEGTTYGFCATSCRDIFAHQHGIALV